MSIPSCAAETSRISQHLRSSDATAVNKEEEAKLQDGSARGAIAFLKRMWNNRKMLLKCNAMLEDLRGRKDPSVLVVKRIKQLEMARPKMLHDQK